MSDLSIKERWECTVITQDVTPEEMYILLKPTDKQKFFEILKRFDSDIVSLGVRFLVEYENSKENDIKIYTQPVNVPCPVEPLHSIGPYYTPNTPIPTTPWGAPIVWCSTNTQSTQQINS